MHNRRNWNLPSQMELMTTTSDLGPMRNGPFSRESLPYPNPCGCRNYRRGLPRFSVQLLLGPRTKGTELISGPDNNGSHYHL